LGEYLVKADSEALRDIQADAIYFLMWSGWKRELRSNRWHFAKQWSQHLPVIMLQPEVDAGKPVRSEVVDGIANCRLLYIRAGGGGVETRSDADQIEQIYADIRLRGFRRPILWLYNPYMVGAFASIPAVARVIHATESYFDWENMERRFLNRLRLCGEIADLIIPVSEGVQACYQKHLPYSKYYLLTNGCDYQSYSSGKSDRVVMELKAKFERVAIYAGNINERLDYQLINDCALHSEDTCLVFFGPASALPEQDAALWSSAVRLPNVRYMGPVEPDRIPDLYKAADLGFIPYKDTVYIRESGFALKALEMIAAGVPTVSTMMRPLVGVSKELHVTESRDEFVSAFARVDRRNLSPSQEAEMREVSLRHDYESRFPLALAAIGDAVGSAPPSRVRIDEFARALSTGELGVTRNLQVVSANYARDIRSYHRSLIRALRVDGSVKSFLRRKIRSSPLAPSISRLLRLLPGPAPVVQWARDWLRRSDC
jgi:glycosyltransferase involved in cell wall biosynthesis